MDPSEDPLWCSLSHPGPHLPSLSHAHPVILPYCPTLCFMLLHISVSLCLGHHCSQHAPLPTCLPQHCHYFCASVSLSSLGSQTTFICRPWELNKKPTAWAQERTPGSTSSHPLWTISALASPRPWPVGLGILSSFFMKASWNLGSGWAPLTNQAGRPWDAASGNLLYLAPAQAPGTYPIQ